MLLIFRNCMYDDLQVLEICCFNVMPSSKVTPRILTVLLNPIILVPTCSVCFFSLCGVVLKMIKSVLFSMICKELCIIHELISFIQFSKRTITL